MDLLALRQRSQSLDNLLIQGESPPASEMTAMLSLLVDAAPRVQSPRDLETVLCLYRKWSVISLRHFAPQDIPVLDRQALRDAYHPKASSAKRLIFRFPRFQQEHEQAHLLAATEAVDPYGRHRENLSALDPAFAQTESWNSELYMAS